MPLDGHSYLVSQGWAGHGNGLRQGSIIRPLAIPQKRTLAGLGKDRDEAFPFWDHLFSVAAKTIQIKVFKEEENDDTTTTSLELDRTTTGIISNKPPKLGTTPAFTSTSTSTSTSGTTTPISHQVQSIQNPSKQSLLVSAKREAAKRTLYARFFRGPVLGPELSEGSTKEREESCGDGRVEVGGSRTPMAIAKAKIATANAGASLAKEIVKPQERKRKRDGEVGCEGDVKSSRQKKHTRSEEKKEKKRKGKQREESSACSPDDEDEKQERKRRRREEKKAKKEKSKKKKKEKVDRNEDGNERKRRKRERKGAEIVVSASPSGEENAEIIDDPFPPSDSASLLAANQDTPGSRKRKKKRKVAEL